MNGFLIINKPQGYTSRDVVNVITKKLGTKKVGHAGTLDPLATGVLVVAVNQATRTLSLLEHSTKEYVAEIILGKETDTLDVTGITVKECQPKRIEKEEVIKVLSSYLGKSMQEVPSFSAVKINGKRLYQYARNNEQVTLPIREIEVFNIELLNDIVYNDSEISFKFRCTVSKGTYIRSLIRDIGLKLNTYGTMKNLTRTKQDNISLKDSINLEDVSFDKMIKIEDIFDYEKIVVDNEQAKKVMNGQIIDKISEDEYCLILNSNNELLAIYQVYEKDNNKMKPVTVFGG